ncbi:MAG: T9SS type A sorting domain-containing protein [Ignavibacteria bacterium]|nr:T9SS type A sorting domain-containing protein [Ignavibacteria bacterium]
MKNRLLFFFSVIVVFAVVLGFYYGGDNRNDSAPLTGNTVTVEGDMVGGWSAGANIPSSHTFGAAGTFVRNDTAWLFCYSNSPASTLLQRYNSRTNTWSTMAPAPNTLDRAAGVVLGDTLYIFGGANASSVYQSSVMRYHIPSNTWSAGNPMPVAKGWGKAVAYQDSLIFIAGGYDGTNVANTPLLYNRITGQYRNCTNMPGTRFGGGFAVTGDTLVYIGGADATLLYNQTYVGVISQSNRSTITWTTGIPAPAPFSPAIFRTDAMNWGCRGVILVHGSTTTAFTGVNGCAVYSPGANTYTPQANMLTGALYAGVGSARFTGNIYRLFVAGGYNNAYLTNTQIFTDTLCPAPPPGPQTTICRSVNLPIIDNAWTRDSIQVTLGSGCVITDVNVRIDTVIHTWDSDLSFYLNKGAVSSLIIDNVGSSGDNFIGTVLNDSASTPIASGTAPFTGQFRPSNPLAPFNFGAGQGDGYWRLSISDTANGDTGSLRRWCLVISYNCPVGGIQTVEIPNYYSLSQNYPNPFNPSTSIKFTMPQGDNVKLVIFDILGREVKTLVNEFRNSGTYEVNFDASLLASGVYFYRLEAGEFTDTKRMLLVK